MLKQNPTTQSAQADPVTDPSPLLALLSAGLSVWIVSDDAPFPKSGVIILTESSVPDALKTVAQFLTNSGLLVLLSLFV
jgi:hypothetical protein